MTTSPQDGNKSNNKAKPDRKDQVIEQLQRQVELLMKTTDQRALARELQRQQSDEDIVREVSLRLYNGKVVVKRSNLLTNDVITHDGRIHEDQTLELTLEDGQVYKITLLEFAKFCPETDPVPILATSKRKDKEGIRRTYLTVEYKGQEYTIDDRFVN